MRRSKQAAEETKLQLIEAACKVFYTEGVAKATLEQIAREAGVTRGALYWHFNNKTDILDAVFHTVMPQLHELDDCLSQMQGDEYWHALEAYYVAFFERLEHNLLLRQFCTVVHLKCEMTENNAQVVSLLARYRHSWEDRIDAIIQQAVVVHALPANTDVFNTVAVFKSHLVGAMVNYLSDIEHGRASLSVSTPILQLQYVFRMLKQMPLLQAS